jgi:hypothetical protein
MPRDEHLEAGAGGDLRAGELTTYAPRIRGPRRLVESSASTTLSTETRIPPLSHGRMRYRGRGAFPRSAPSRSQTPNPEAVQVNSLNKTNN